MISITERVMELDENFKKIIKGLELNSSFEKEIEISKYSTPLLIDLDAGILRLLENHWNFENIKQSYLFAKAISSIVSVSKNLYFDDVKLGIENSDILLNEYLKKYILDYAIFGYTDIIDKNSTSSLSNQQKEQIFDTMKFVTHIDIKNSNENNILKSINPETVNEAKKISFVERLSKNIEKFNNMNR